MQGGSLAPDDDVVRRPLRFTPPHFHDDSLAITLALLPLSLIRDATELKDMAIKRGISIVCQRIITTSAP